MSPALKPDWSALEAAVRAVIILGAATFVGALVLPVSTSGTLPITWVAWRPVLATAGSAAFVAEVIYLRLHWGALAASLGLVVPVPASAPAPATAATVIKIAGPSLLALCLMGCLMMGCLPAVSPAQQIQDGEALEACVAANWGQSVEAIAGACLNSDIPAAIDLIADLEALIETLAGTSSASSPYAGDARVMSAVPAKILVLHTKIRPIVVPASAGSAK